MDDGGSTLSSGQDDGDPPQREDEPEVPFAVQKQVSRGGGVRSMPRRRRTGQFSLSLVWTPPQKLPQDVCIILALIRSQNMFMFPLNVFKFLTA